MTGTSPRNPMTTESDDSKGNGSRLPARHREASAEADGDSRSHK